jgi:DNA-binding MurR/RpiR family transcriptional regulator
MEVHIGVVYTPKELTLELDGSADDVVNAVEKAVDAKAPVLWLTDTKGRRVGIPADKIAYVEVGADDESHRVGFGKA